MNTSSLNQPFRASIDRTDLMAWLIATLIWFIASFIAIFTVLAGFTSGAGARQSHNIDPVAAGYSLVLRNGPVSGAVTSPFDEIFNSTGGASIRILGVCVTGAYTSGQQGCSSAYHQASAVDSGTITH